MSEKRLGAAAFLGLPARKLSESERFFLVAAAGLGSVGSPLQAIRVGKALQRRLRRELKLPRRDSFSMRFEQITPFSIGYVVAAHEAKEAQDVIVDSLSWLVPRESIRHLKRAIDVNAATIELLMEEADDVALSILLIWYHEPCGG